MRDRGIPPSKGGCRGMCLGKTLGCWRPRHPVKSSQDFTLRHEGLSSLHPPSKGDSGDPCTLSGSKYGRFEGLTRSSLRPCRRYLLGDLRFRIAQWRLNKNLLSLITATLFLFV